MKLEAYTKLATMLRTKPEVLEDYANRLTVLTGKTGIIEKIVQENDHLVDRTLTKLGVERTHTYQEIYDELVNRIHNLDARLYHYLGAPDLMQLSHVCGKLCETAIKLVLPKPGPARLNDVSRSGGYFLKKEKAIELLAANPPTNLLEHFGYKDARELVNKHGFAPVFSALRFAQSEEWMHSFFSTAYKDLTAEDFEERDVEMIVLDPEWLKVAEKFMKHKYHNVSHLKELGIIFIVPIKLDLPGETLRMFSLLLHYLNEVPFYSKIIKKFSGEADFISKLQSLLRGDVPGERIPSDATGTRIRIVQRYLAKDDENDFRLLEPHVNPEAEHWYRAETDLEKLLPGNWPALDCVGMWKDEQLLSFDLIDLVMSLVQKGEVKYLYHQEEALWNKILVEYLGRDKMNTLIEENIIKGYITL